MLKIVFFSFVLLGMLVLAVRKVVQKDIARAVVFGGVAFLSFILVVFSAWDAGIEELRITKGRYYEVVLAAPVPYDGKILVYAIDLEGNKEKTDILAEYPIEGYKIEKSGKRTFLIPTSTRITTDTSGDVILLSGEGEAIIVPAVQ